MQDHADDGARDESEAGKTEEAKPRWQNIIGIEAAMEGEAHRMARHIKESANDACGHGDAFDSIDYARIGLGIFVWLHHDGRRINYHNNICKVLPLEQRLSSNGYGTRPNHIMTAYEYTCCRH